MRAGEMLRVLLLVSLGLMAADARVRSKSARMPALPAEFVSSDCYRQAMPLLKAVKDTLHSRRHNIRQGCHGDPGNMIRVMKQNRDDVDARMRLRCKSKTHLATCNYFNKHYPFGMEDNFLNARAASALHQMCASRLSGVVDDLRDESVQLVTTLATCAPEHACYLYNMAMDNEYHIGMHLHQEMNGHINDLCRRGNLSPKLSSMCERYNMSHGVLTLVRQRWHSIFTLPFAQKCNKRLARPSTSNPITTTTTAAATTTTTDEPDAIDIQDLYDDVVNQLVQGGPIGFPEEAPMETTEMPQLITVATAKQNFYFPRVPPLVPEMKVKWVEKLKKKLQQSPPDLFETDGRMLESQEKMTKPEDNTPEDTPAASRISFKAKKKETTPRMPNAVVERKKGFGWVAFTCTIVPGIIVIILCVVCIVRFQKKHVKEAFRLKSSASSNRGSDSDSQCSQQPLATKTQFQEKSDIAELMKLQQQGYENPAYSYFEDLPCDADDGGWTVLGE